MFIEDLPNSNNYTYQLGEDKKMSSVCRVCLAGNLELNSLKNNHLILVYEKLFETKFYSDDTRPRVLCCFCYQGLLKCHKLSQMAHRSEKIFSQFVHQGLEATHGKITELNLGKEQHLSVATMQYVMIDKHHYEPILVKEEVTTEEEQLMDVEALSHEDCTKTLEDSGRQTDVKECIPYIHVEEAKPDDSKKTLCCNYCSKVFFHKNTLISHITKSHSNLEEKRKYSCNVCKKIYNQNNHLLNHMKTHTGKKSFACNQCDKKIMFKGGLVKHIKWHTGEKPFACNVCSKHFHQKGGLNSHMRTHTGEKPFACNLCGKQFSNKSNLTPHIMRYHTGEKPFACNVCSEHFHEKSGLNSHMRTHTGEKPFACNLCGKQFSNKSNLIPHMRYHTGEKPFGCNVCDKHFKRKCTLVIHMRTHTGKKPFACNVCDKKFSHKCNLVNHKKTHW